MANQIFPWVTQYIIVCQLNSSHLQTYRKQRRKHTAAAEASVRRGASCFLTTVVKRNPPTIPQLQQSKALTRTKCVCRRCCVSHGSKTMWNVASPASSDRAENPCLRVSWLTESPTSCPSNSITACSQATNRQACLPPIAPWIFLHRFIQHERDVKVLELAFITPDSPFRLIPTFVGHI